MRLILLLMILGLGVYGVLSAVQPGGEQLVRNGLKVDRAAGTPVDMAADAAADVAAGAPVVQASAAVVPAAPVLAHVSRPQVLSEALVAPDAVQPMTVAARAVAAMQTTAQGEGVFRRVTANSANVRSGPSTGFDVVGRLPRGEEVLVLETDASGWARIQIQGDGIEGWMAGRLLSN